MANYAKALSTYKRINSIKRSTEKISEVQNMIGERRAKAESEARELVLNRNLASSIAQGVSQAASVGLNYGLGDTVNPDTINAISAGVGGLSSGIADISSGRANLADASFRTRDYVRESRANPFSDALNSYAFSQQVGEGMRSSKLESDIDNLDGDYGGFSKDQLYDEAQNVEWQKGTGWDFTEIIEMLKKRNRQKLITSGYIKE